MNITDLTAGQVITGLYNLTCSVSGNVTKVVWWIDGVQLGTSTTAPFSLKWYAQYGYNAPHTIKAVATDAAGDSASSSVPIVLNHP